MPPREAPKDKYRTHVLKKIPPKILDEITNYITLHAPLLWGTTQPRMFLKHTLWSTLLHDLNGKSMNTIAKDLGVSNDSVAHNIRVMRKKLALWAKTHIKAGQLSDWVSTARKSKFLKKVRDANLLMDSTDFALYGKRKTSKKSTDWSFKLNGPGQRYMFVLNTKSKVLFASNGYSPKIDDNSYLSVVRPILERKFKGGIVLADCGFSYGRDHYTKMKFYVPWEKPKGRKKKDPTAPPPKLTKEKETWNYHVVHSRGRVESPFGLIKQKWQNLGNAFREGVQQQDLLVTIAIGVYNCM